jgi:hypothetical protein
MNDQFEGAMGAMQRSKELQEHNQNVNSANNKKKKEAPT